MDNVLTTAKMEKESRSIGRWRRDTINECTNQRDIAARRCGHILARLSEGVPYFLATLGGQKVVISRSLHFDWLKVFMAQ